MSVAIVGVGGGIQAKVRAKASRGIRGAVHPGGRASKIDLR